MYMCSTCAKIIKPGKKTETGRIAYQCFCYGNHRTITVLSESDLKMQGCGDWKDPKQDEIKLFNMENA